jgi:hypothetical protein
VASKRPLVFRLAAIAIAVITTLVIGSVLLVATYGAQFHTALTGAKWPVDSYRYNADLANFELTPGLSKPLLDGTYYLKTHEMGFRIPRSQDGRATQPGGLLAIGCSFTFGDGVEAEQTFAYVAGRALGLPVYNYGVSSYSYASVVLQLEDLERRGVLAELSPSVIVLGAGGWLMGRSVNPFYPTPDIQLTYPYIARDGEGDPLEIQHPPDFISVRHAVGFAASHAYFDAESRDVPFDLRRKLRLLDTIPRVLVTRVHQRFFENQMTTDDLYAFVIGRLSDVAERVGAGLVVLNMPMSASESTIDEGLVKAVASCGCATLVSGYDGLARWRTLNAQLVHPDRRAHAAYAAELARSIDGLQATDPRPPGNVE